MNFPARHAEPIRGHILLVDDEAPLRQALAATLEHIGYAVTSCEGAAEARALAIAQPDAYDLLLTDLTLIGEDGLTLLASLRPVCPALVGVVITGHTDTPHAVQSLRAGAFDFVPKPIERTELEMSLERALRHHEALLEGIRSRAALRDMADRRGVELIQARHHLEASYQFMLESLVSLLESREKDAGEHTQRVTALALVLAGEFHLPPADRETLRRGALLHDIGKVAIPDRILHKPGPLDADEWRIMQSHVAVGYDILKSNPYLKEVADLVHSHHEHFDGAGYPRGLLGEQIPLLARIFSVVDAYDAIRAVRPYSAAQTEEETIRRLVAARGTQFDPRVVDALLRCRPALDQVWSAPPNVPPPSPLNAGATV